MTLLTFIIALVVLGLGFYLVENYIPMSRPFKVVVRVVSVVILLFLVLALFNIVNFPFRLK